MGKRISFILFIIFCFLLLGCQQTPDSRLIIKKNIEKMLTQAMATHDTNKSVSERLNIPEKYSAKLSGNNVNVNVNASITVPAVNEIPIMKIKGVPFSQEETDRLIDVFFNGNQLYTFDSLSIETKDDIILRLAQYKEKKAQLEQAGMKPLLSHNLESDSKTATESEETDIEDSPKSGNELDNVLTMIEIYERKLKQAPAEKELIESSGQLEPFNLSGEKEDSSTESGLLLESGHFGLVNTNGYCERLKVTNNEAYNLYYAEYVNRDDYFDSGIYFTGQQWEQWEQTLGSAYTPEEPSLKEAEAKEITEDFLRKMGIDYLTCVNIDNVIGITGVYDSTGAELGERINGFRLQYVRSVNNIPVTYTSQEEAYNEYSQSWYYERMTFIVNDRGIAEMDWYSPYQIKETITNSSNMLPFDEIKKIFDKWILIKQEDEINDYQKQFESIVQNREINITDIRLGLMRITEPNNINNGYLVPVWDFFGTATFNYKSDGETASPTDYDSYKSYLTINAIDGSIIDRNLGY